MERNTRDFPGTYHGIPISEITHYQGQKLLPANGKPTELEIAHYEETFRDIFQGVIDRGVIIINESGNRIPARMPSDSEIKRHAEEFVNTLYELSDLTRSQIVPDGSLEEEVTI